MNNSMVRAIRACRGAALASVVLLLLSNGCASSRGVSGTDCDIDEDCSPLVCIDGSCAEAPDASGDEDALPPIGDTTDDVPSDDGNRGDYLAPCSSDDDCESGYCLTSPQGRVCTIHCQHDEECAEAAGWRCRRVAGRGADIEELCYPEFDDLCGACSFDTDCGGTSDRCVELDDGTFCGLNCAGGSACPLGFTCVLVEDGIEQCLPDENLCGPCRGADLLADIENCGECGRRCAFPNAVATCMAGTCDILACDPGFANCDGSLETGCETRVDRDLNNCGECGRVCTSTTGVASCEAAACVDTPCEHGRASCDGNPETGCETDLETDPNHCGECGNGCDDEPCIDGRCGCEGDLVPCDNVCVEPNACGGCAALADSPETPCGDCGLDQIVCEGTEATTCGGNTTNACGGCDDLDIALGTPCGDCVSWSCEATSLVCPGAPDLDNDANNCGECGTACQGGRICSEGTCTCPEGTRLCGDTCQEPNACGGCSTLTETPLSACGPCELDMWICDGEEDVACNGNTASMCGGCDGLDQIVGDDCGSCGNWACNGEAWTCSGEVNTSSDPDNCGECGNTCTGGAVCSGGVCRCASGEVQCGGQCRAPNACGGCGNFSRQIGDTCGSDCGRWDCDDTSWTCEDERDRLTDPNNCGSCGLQCRADETCSGGVCGCPTGRIECNGQCVTPNACGGCGPLPGAPDTPCETCGVWTCQSGTAVCTGSTNTDTDPANCGSCGITCRADQVCAGGTCGCPGGQIECSGQCRTPNACGGCGNFNRSVGDDCENCGNWQCGSGTTWMCSGQVNLQTDPTNCGNCGTTCTGGQTCSNGSCGCPGGQILCGGTCQTPNVCGGCGSLNGPIGSNCGTCSTGTWTCQGSGTSANTQCTGQVSLNTSNSHCGSCNNACTGGTSCSGGNCVCPAGQLLCGGVCQANNGCGGCTTLANPPTTSCGPCGANQYVCDGNNNTVCNGSTTNACGGCDNISRTIGSSCGTCGSWGCSGTSWVCNGSTNTQTDPNNCGSCNNQCAADQTCSGGSCVCNTGRPYNRVWIRSQSVQFTSLTSYLQSLGYTVTRSQGGFFSSTLDNQDILVLDSPAISSGFSPTPQQLLNFVNGGGSVIFIGGSGATVCEGLNPYLNAFGMRFSNVGNATGPCSGGGFSSGSNLSLSISAHPVTRNASLSNANLAQRNGWRARDIGGGSDRLATQSSNSNMEVLRARQVGCGRVLVLSDGRIATDMESGNQTFWRQAMEWLAFQR